MGGGKKKKKFGGASCDISDSESQTVRTTLDEITSSKIESARTLIEVRTRNRTMFDVIASDDNSSDYNIAESDSEIMYGDRLFLLVRMPCHM